MWEEAGDRDKTAVSWKQTPAPSSTLNAAGQTRLGVAVQDPDLGLSDSKATAVDRRRAWSMQLWCQLEVLYAHCISPGAGRWNTPSSSIPLMATVSVDGADIVGEPGMVEAARDLISRPGWIAAICFPL